MKIISSSSDRAARFTALIKAGVKMLEWMKKCFHRWKSDCYSKDALVLPLAWWP